MQTSELTQQHLALWWDEGGAADWGPTYTAGQQAEREAELARFQDSVSAEARAGDRGAAEEHILGSLQGLARSLGLEAHIGHLLRSGMVDTAKAFARQARRFDPQISSADLYQAGRNVWTMNGLQILLGRPVQLTPAVFAYSLLYPYTDNYLDDAGVPAEEKAAFNRRFGMRLAGESPAPASGAERAIFDLVGQIEGHLPRAGCPQVYDSLLAIHSAQERSVRLLRRSAPPYAVDVLGIGLEKGGASVLADGYLVAEGDLAPGQAAAFFGLGAFLQLADDLQDVRADQEAGLLTVFSHAAGRWPLDPLADRAWRFGQGILRGLGRSAAPGAELLAELIPVALRQLLLQAVAGAGDCFTRPYLQQLERHSPFRFAFLEQRRKALGKQRGLLGQMVEDSLAR